MELHASLAGLSPVDLPLRLEVGERQHTTAACLSALPLIRAPCGPHLGAPLAYLAWAGAPPWRLFAAANGPRWKDDLSPGSQVIYVTTGHTNRRGDGLHGFTLRPHLSDGGVCGWLFDAARKEMETSIQFHFLRLARAMRRTRCCAVSAARRAS